MAVIFCAEQVWFFCSSVYYYVTITFHLYSPVRTLAQHYQVNTELGIYCTCCHK